MQFPGNMADALSWYIDVLWVFMPTLVFMPTPPPQPHPHAFVADIHNICTTTDNHAAIKTHVIAIMLAALTLIPDAKVLLSLLANP